MRSGGKSADWMAPAAVALTALLFLLVHPVGFVGGGNDDQHYLAAARCWLHNGGACLPHNHWETRWPTIAPIAAMLSMLGDNRDALGVAPLAYWIAALVLFGWLGRLWFDRTTGLVAAALFSAVPVFTLAALQPDADNAELCFQLAALCVATIAYRRQSVWAAVAAGLLASLACQARETSALFLLLSALAWLRLPAGRRNILLYCIAGLALGLAAEMVAYGALTGDPLFRYRLALGHGAVPSAELASSVDTSRSALFNPDFIAGWRREMGIRLWWPLDPWLNLLATPRLGATLVLAAVTFATARRRLPAEWKARLKVLAVLSALLALALVYILAVDPKSRMFLLPAAAATLGIAACLVTMWRDGERGVALVIVALLAIVGIVGLRTKTDPRPFERAARFWIAGQGSRIEIDEPTQATLALVSEAQRLPLRGSGKPLRLSIGIGGCEQLTRQSPGKPPLARILGAAGEAGHDQLCLLEYTSAGQVQSRRRSPGEQR